MRISAKGTLYGYPALKVRELLRAGSSWGLRLTEVGEAMGIDGTAAEALVLTLEGDGCLERPRATTDGTIVWELSIKGAALAMASAGPPMKRRDAEELLEAFLDRVERVRDSPAGDEFPIKVRTVVLFGSFLSAATELSDIDVAIEFCDALGNREEQRAAEDRCRDRAVANGRDFADFLARLSWPDTEVRRFLRDRRPISIHDPRTDASVIEAGPHVTIYADGRVCVGAIPLLLDWNTQPAAERRALAAAARRIASLKRADVARKKIIKEQAEMIAKLNWVNAMSNEEQERRQDEISALHAAARRLMNPRLGRHGR